MFCIYSCWQDFPLWSLWLHRDKSKPQCARRTLLKFQISLHSVTLAVHWVNCVCCALCVSIGHVKQTYTHIQSHTAHACMDEMSGIEWAAEMCFNTFCQSETREMGNNPPLCAHTHLSNPVPRLSTQLLPSVPHTDKSLWAACSTI